MELKWKILFKKTLVWIVAEIILNCLGVDTLADYSEFVFDTNTLVHLNHYGRKQTSLIALGLSPT